MKKKVLIGLTTDLSEDKKYSDCPYYALRKNYTEILTQENTSAILLPPIKQNIDSYLDIIDGLVITGGTFDIHPKFYNSDVIHPSTKTNNERSEFEYELTKLAIKKGIPILGICGGMQLINVIFGGCLIQDIDDHGTNYLAHEKKPYSNPAHLVNIKTDSLLFDIIQKSQIAVNSSHHQAINKLAKDLIASAISEDGIIEAIEAKNYQSFMIGVQWHPEYNVTPADSAIFQHFTTACKRTVNYI